MSINCAIRVAAWIRNLDGKEPNKYSSHEAIKEVAVYGVPDPIKGEAVKAAVVLKKGAHTTSDEIIAFCRERIAAYKVPSVVEFLNELPKSATGKILKRVLRTS